MLELDKRKMELSSFDAWTWEEKDGVVFVWCLKLTIERWSYLPLMLELDKRKIELSSFDAWTWEEKDELSSFDAWTWEEKDGVVFVWCLKLTRERWSYLPLMLELDKRKSYLPLMLERDKRKMSYLPLMLELEKRKMELSSFDAWNW